MGFSWQIPTIAKGIKRSNIGSCIVTPDQGTDPIEIALSIVKVAIVNTEPKGLGQVTDLVRQILEQPLFDDDEESYIRQNFLGRDEVDLDYWSGAPVKLFMEKQDDGTLAISINSWLDRQSGPIPDIPMAIEELEQVLQTAQQLLVSGV